MVANADLVIADITRQNPSVLYELGYAHALKKPTLLLMDSASDAQPPSDLLGHQVYFYDQKDLGDAGRRVRRVVERLREPGL